MFVFRTRHGRIPDPDPAIEGQLVAHIRNVARGADERGAAYPTIEVCAPSGRFAGYVQPWHRTLRVIAFGLDAANGELLEARLRTEVLEHRTTSPGSRLFGRTATAYDPAEAKRLETVKVHTYGPSTRVLGNFANFDQFGDERRARIDLVPDMDKNHWGADIWQKIGGVVLYDPLGILSGWGHRAQRDGTTVAFHFPSEPRDFAMLGEGCEVVRVNSAARYSISRTVSGGEVTIYASWREGGDRFPPSAWVDEFPEKLSCGCDYTGAAVYLTATCTCPRKSSVRRLLCSNCVHKKEQNYATFDCSRWCDSVVGGSAKNKNLISRQCLERKHRRLFDGGAKVGRGHVADLGEGEVVCYMSSGWVREHIPSLVTELAAPLRKIYLLS